MKLKKIQKKSSPKTSQKSHQKRALKKSVAKESFASHFSANAPTKGVALVTGANKGLGFAASEELAKLGYHVIMLARRKTPLLNAVKTLQAKGYAVEPIVGDVTQASTAKRAKALVEKKFNKLDILINNAGIYEGSIANPNIQNVDAKNLLAVFDINTVGAYRMLQALLPLLQKSELARVVNISSGMGQLTDMNGGFPAYRLSKAALNALTKSTSEDFGGEKLKINSVCPGWVRTEMGGASATRSVEEGVRGIVWAATLGSEGPTGGFFRDGQALPW